MKRLMTTICEPLISALLGDRPKLICAQRGALASSSPLVFGYCQIRGIPFSEERFALVAAFVALAEAYVAQAPRNSCMPGAYPKLDGPPGMSCFSTVIHRASCDFRPVAPPSPFNGSRFYVLVVFSGPHLFQAGPPEGGARSILHFLSCAFHGRGKDEVRRDYPQFGRDYSLCEVDRA